MARQVTPGPVPVPALSDALPAAPGVAASGVSGEASRADHVHTAPDNGEAITALGTVSADIAIDLSTGGVRTMTLAADVTISATGMSATKSCVVDVIITASGARVLAFPSAWKWIGDKPAALAAGLSGILNLRNKGSAATDVIAVWAPL